VIEHVGPPPKQAEFAREVIRLGRSYWVQTPSKWFPIEVHSGMPFYWFYPEWLRAALFRNWRKRLPAWWASYMDATRVLSRHRMSELFPNGRTRVDYFLASRNPTCRISPGHDLAKAKVHTSSRL
jgi:hypothetical protein